MMNRILLTPILMAVWLALWGEASVGNIVSGVIVIAVVMIVFDQGHQLHTHRLSPVGMIRMITVFLRDLVVSSWRVVGAVLAPTPQRLRTGVVAVPLTCADPLVLKTVSDLLCLTPGTLTVEIDTEPTVLYVHVLGLGDPDDVRREVQALEARVLAAFPSVLTASSHPDEAET
jgi:multicomponent Na+:H+ antiporter subunit E